MTPERQREIAWVGEDDLVSGAARVARAGTLACVQFLSPHAAGGDRKVLADDVRQAMLRAYAAAANRPR